MLRSFSIPVPRWSHRPRRPEPGSPRTWLLPSLLVLTIAASGCGDTAKDTAEDLKQYLDSARQYSSEGKHAEAIVQYRNALKLDPQVADTHYQLADAYEKSGNLRNAFPEYMRAANLSDRTEYQLKAGNLLLAAGEFEEARKRAASVLEKEPANVEAHILRGRATAGLKDLDGAIADLEAALDVASDPDRLYTTLGVLQVAKGRRTEAEAAFRQAVTLQPRSANAHLALALFYWATGRAAEAEAGFRKAVDVDPANGRTQRLLAAFYLASRRPELVEAPLKAAAADPKDVRARLVLADFYSAIGRHDQAAGLLKALATERDGFADATVRLAALDVLEGRRADAYKKLDAVLGREPHHTPALMAQVQLLLSDGKPDEALERAKIAVAADPRSAPAQFLLGRVQTTRHDFPAATLAFNDVLKLEPRAAAAQLELARLSLTQGDAAAAVRFATEAVREGGSLPGAQLFLARALAAHGEFSRAETLLHEIMTADPKQPAVYAELGRVALARQDPAAARRAFDRALQLDASLVDAASGIVTLDIMERKLGHARSLVEAGLAASPRNAQLLLLSARISGASGDERQQEDALRRAIEIEPANLDAYGALATLFVHQRRLGEARAEFERLANAQPSLVGPLTMVGVLLEAQNKIDEAQRVYERLVATTPSAAVAANNLAWIYAERGGDLDAALQLAQGAQQQLPDVPQVNDTLGWVYLKKDLPRYAVPAFESSVRQNPRDPVLRYHLGIAYQRIGREDKARTAFDEVLRQKPDYREALEARNRLVSIP